MRTLLLYPLYFQQIDKNIPGVWVSRADREPKTLLEDWTPRSTNIELSSPYDADFRAKPFLRCERRRELATGSGPRRAPC
jgi:hypothetical protein